MRFAQSHTIYQGSTSGKLTRQETRVIGEQPVQLTVNSQSWVTLMCTPLDLEALGIGFLFNEGVIHKLEDIKDIRVCPTEDNIDIWLGFSVEKPTQWFRTSGCTGGQTSVASGTVESDSDLNIISPPEMSSPLDDFYLTPRQVAYLTSELFERQEVYKQTGGVHTSALSDGKQILVVSEDVGRHNTLDKIAGKCLMEKINPVHKIILTTGRISSEMLQKTSRLGASILVSRTAPTSLSIQLAHARNITLIGYARRSQFNVYTHPQRIKLEEDIGADKTSSNPFNVHSPTTTRTG